MPKYLSFLCTQVILLPSYGLSAPSVPLAPLQPLKLPHPQAIAVHLAAESAQYWRGIELLAQARLLQPCPSLDVVLNAEREHQGAVTMELIQVGKQECWEQHWGCSEHYKQRFELSCIGKSTPW